MANHTIIGTSTRILRCRLSTNIEGLFHPIFYSNFGLAMRPYNVRSLKDGPVSVEELEEMG